ncbi:peptidylprolyl isomerase [Ichthyobacterium seriolicida]|uniref:Periplasmic chaperone PpiD n=1 Tax=Ichthyobacterium seriolicida TaxID=242600 RepID=A0A1J1DYR3_9FLAO|nr:SurA N-terminal domain-containing protein [Ichthyobacterium seriolicida]BAV95055.1 PpiC-type peptidyl-prolyl cis-trans isomerase [Ichthyobacterium seriolicida]
MAALEKIRKKSGLLLVVIGGAMLCFILSDVINSSSSIFNSGKNVIGKIDGNQITYSEFDSKVKKLHQNYSSSRSISNSELVNMVWENELKNSLFGSQYEKLGLIVGHSEIWKSIIKNPQLISNPSFKGEGGDFDENKLKEYLSKIKSDNSSNGKYLWNNWLAFEKEIKESVYLKTYTDMLSFGLYKTALDQDYTKFSRLKDVNASILYLPYSSIPNKDVEISDDEIKKYISENSDMYKRDISRDIQYVKFDVVPSPEDEKKILDSITDVLEGRARVDISFKDVKDVKSFVNTYSAVPYSDKYIFNDEIDSELKDFVSTSGVGAVSQIYKKGDSYNISRIMDIRDLPDSVQASHIVLSHKELRNSVNVRTKSEAKSLADSLLKVLERDSSKFNSFVKGFSDDPNKESNNGDIGWFRYGMTNLEFNDFCFLNKKNEIGVVKTPMGFHIIRIDQQKDFKKAFKIANVSMDIFPSEITENDIYSKAMDFKNKSNNIDEFLSTSESQKLKVEVVEGLSKMEYNLPGIGKQREVIRWAFNGDTKFEQVKLFNSENSYIIAVISGINDKEVARVEDVRSEVSSILRKNKKSKILEDKLIDQIKKGSNDLKGISSSLGESEIDVNINLFDSNIVTDIGNEPKVVGAVIGMEQGQLSNPVIGYSGVFLVRVNNKNFLDKEKLDDAKQVPLVSNGFKFMNFYKLLETLKDQVVVEDNRHSFY